MDLILRSLRHELRLLTLQILRHRRAQRTGAAEAMIYAIPRLFFRPQPRSVRRRAGQTEVEFHLSQLCDFVSGGWQRVFDAAVSSTRPPGRRQQEEAEE